MLGFVVCVRENGQCVKMNLHETGWGVWTAFIWLRIGARRFRTAIVGTQQIATNVKTKEYCVGISGECDMFSRYIYFQRVPRVHRSNVGGTSRHWQLHGYGSTEHNVQVFRRPVVLSNTFHLSCLVSFPTHHVFPPRFLLRLCFTSPSPQRVSLCSSWPVTWQQCPRGPNEPGR